MIERAGLRQRHVLSVLDVVCSLCSLRFDTSSSSLAVSRAYFESDETWCRSLRRCFDRVVEAKGGGRAARLALDAPRGRLVSCDRGRDMAPNRRPVRVSLSLLLAAVVTLHAFAGRGDLFYAELTLCNGLTSDGNPNDSILDIEITPFHGATRYVSVAFGRCATVEGLDIGAALGKVRVHLFTTDRVLSGESYMPVLSEARRNYAVAYTSGMWSIDLAAPSSHFDKVTPGDVRFVWLNLCTLCAGDASAWVGQGYTTKIPDKGPLSYGADNPVERQQTPPGPFGTIGDTALFTEYAEGSSRPGARNRRVARRVTARATSPRAPAARRSRPPPPPRRRRGALGRALLSLAARAVRGAGTSLRPPGAQPDHGGAARPAARRVRQVRGGAQLRDAAPPELGCGARGRAPWGAWGGERPARRRVCGSVLGGGRAAPNARLTLTGGGETESLSGVGWTPRAVAA